MKKVLTLMLSAALVFGCGNDETTDESTAAGQLPTGGKFDTPAGTERPEDFCAKRRAEARNCLRQPGAQSAIYPG